MTEQLVQTEFQILLAAFNKLVATEPPVPKIKDELLEIKAAAIQSAELNSRQTEAVTARVDNYINGTYGKSQKKIDYMATQKS